MTSSPLRTGLTAVWAALHITQFGLAISGLNGVQDAVTCSTPSDHIGAHSLAPSSWLKPRVAMTVSCLMQKIVAVLSPRHSRRRNLAWS